ncbi:MAG: hypothetical protein A2044_05400 [Candidatus Firestonebacteria bacterium GWA2_43_8]|nr:MAG: hypothetical protein A2044_05400 [Candidatus Firestonebacteria bacterium GWA2_43_8]
MISKEKNPLPIYYQLKQILRSRIIEGDFQEKLPTEHQLKKMYGVSLWTIKRSLEDLVDEGLIRKFRGRGSFVQKNNIKLADKAATDKVTATNNLGFIFYRSQREFKLDEYYADLFDKIEKLSKDQGYHIFMSSIFNYDGTYQNMNKIIEDKKVDGFFLIGLEDNFTEQFDKMKIPFVLVDSRSSKYDCVMADNIGGAIKATEYLITVGHKKIAYIGALKGDSTSYADANEEWPNSLERRMGYQQVMEQRGLAANILVRNVFDFNTTDRVTDEFIDEKITAVVCSGDYLAALVKRRATEKGLTLPRDLSIVGFGNSTLSYLNNITTLNIDRSEIALESVNRLLAKIKQNGSNGTSSKQVSIPVELIVRGSVVELVKA